MVYLLKPEVKIMFYRIIVSPQLLNKNSVWNTKKNSYIVAFKYIFHLIYSLLKTREEENLQSKKHFMEFYFISAFDKQISKVLNEL